MEQDVITKEDVSFIMDHYPALFYNKEKRKISGKITFDLIYNDIRIRDHYEIEIILEINEDSILPKVKETGNKILGISKRKKINWIDLHLNNESGELCLIIPLKEKEKYPNGFDMKEFLYHIEEHLYWVSYYGRYEKPPWKEQAHGIDGYIQLYHENNSYRPDVKKMVERLIKKPISRSSFRKMMNKRTKSKKHE